jgi:LytS/YehU family sensor histidine kinase
MAFCGMRFYYEHNKLEKTLLESQLHTLQSQINPHFMFNVLNHIHYYVAKKDDLATTLLLKYSEILRYQLYSGKKETVSLEEEVQFLKNFIDIERIRWEDKINISCSWCIEDSTKRLPSLILIPLIENAFKHVSKGLKEKGYINILLEQKEDRVYLEVENSKLDSQRKKTNEKIQGAYIFRQLDSFQKINCEDILFVEAMQNYLKLHFRNSTLVIHQTMSSLEEALPKDSFFRIHKSFLINNAYVDKVSGGRLFINGIELPISKHRRTDFLNSVVYNKLASK